MLTQSSDSAVLVLSKENVESTDGDREGSIDGSSAESIKDYGLLPGSIHNLFNWSPFGKHHRSNPL